MYTRTFQITQIKIVLSINYQFPRVQLIESRIGEVPLFIKRPNKLATVFPGTPSKDGRIKTNRIDDTLKTE